MEGGLTPSNLSDEDTGEVLVKQKILSINIWVIKLFTKTLNPHGQIFISTWGKPRLESLFF